MADGTPDFTDLLAAFDDPPAVNQNQNTLGYVTSNFQGGQLQFSNLPSQLQVNAIPFGSDQSQSLFAPVNQAAAPQGQLRQISAAVPDASHLQNQPFQQRSGQDALQLNMAPAPTAEDTSFSGGSLGSMFLSSVELALSGENTDPYVVKIAPPAARARKAPKRVRQPSKQNSLPQQQQISQNVNANTGMQMSPFGTVTQPPAQVVVTPQNTVLLNTAQPKTSQVSSPPFVLPSDVQVAAAGPQKTMVQNQFMHPTQLTRQQISGPGSNPPRPLSATSSTSDHRPGSVPQPSPSCGSNHSGDPATPLTPQAYNAAVPQNYNAATPQPRSITPQVAGLQQQRAGSYSDISKQLPHKGNSAQGNLGGHTMDLGLTLQRASKNPGLSNPSSSDLQAPLKQMLAGNQGLYGNLNDSSSFPDSLGISATNAHGAQQWFSQGQQQIQSKPLSLPSDSHGTAQPSYVLSGNQPYGHTINALGMSTLPVTPAYYERNESSAGGTGSLTQKQSKLLEQVAASYGNKAKKPSDASQAPLPQGGSLPASNNVGFQANRISGGHADGRVNPSDNNLMMDIMNKASDAGAATVKELFDSHATQYEAISPVSDYAMSPINKTNLTEDSLFGQTKMTDQSNSSTHDDAMTDPVLMYIKQDNVTHAASTTAHGPSMTSTSFSQGANNYYSPNVHGLLAGEQTSNLKKNDFVGGNLDTRGSSGSTYFASALPNMLNFSQPADVSNVYGNATTTSAWESFSTISKSSNFSSGDIGASATTGGIKSLLTGPSQLTKDREKFSSAASDKSLPEKQSSFGVSRRKSSTEKTKFSLAPQVSKGGSLESDFGFESDDDTEPTICLSKAVGKSPKGTGNKPGPTNKPDAGLASPKQRPINSNMPAVNAHIPDGMRDTLEQMRRLKQQNQLLQQMKQQQAAKANAAASNSTNLQGSNQPGGGPGQVSPKTSVPNVLHYQGTKQDAKNIPTAQISPVKSRRRTSSDLRVQPQFGQPAPQNPKVPAPQTMPPANWSVSPPQPMRQNRPYTSVSTPDTRVSVASSAEPVRSLELKDSPLRFTTSYTKQQHPIQPPIAAIQPPTVLPTQPKSSSVSHSTSSLSYLLSRPQMSQATKTVPSVPTQVPVTQVPPYVSSFLSTPTTDVTTSLPKKNLNHKLPPYTNFATTANVSPAAVSISQTMMPFPYPNMPLAQTFHPHFFPGGPMPPFSMSARPAHISAKADNVPKTTSTIAPAPLDLDWLPQEPEPSVKTVSAPQLSFPVVSTVNLLASTSSATMTSTMSGIPKPSFYSPKTESSIPQKPEPQKAFDQPPRTKTETLQTPTTKPIPISEATVVHHEPKHHYGKKHRILEGSYPNSSEPHYKYGQAAASHVTMSQTNGIVAHSVLDKQRRYSKEHNATAKYRKPHHSVIDAKSSPASSLVQTTALNLTPSTGTSKVAGTPNIAEKAKVDRKPTVSEPLKKTDDQAGSMLSLFNSLLKEASNDSLKTSLKSTDEKEKSELIIPTNGTAVATPEPIPLPVAKPASVPSSVSVPSAVVTTTPAVTTKPVVPVQKTVAKKRPAATVPFKRRPYPAFDDTTPASIPSVPEVAPAVPSASSTVSTAISKPVTVTNQVLSLKPIPTTISSISKVAVSKENVPAAPPAAVTSTVTSTSVSVSKPSEVTATVEATKESPGKPGIGLPKLRITAFRSSGGQVIHQASMIGGANADTEDKPQRHKHLKKKKKKKRRRKRQSSSDNDSVSSLTSMSSFEPVSKNPPAVIKVTDPVITAKSEAPTTVAVPATKQAPKRKRANANAANKDPEKKKPAATKRAKVTKDNNKKKVEPKNKEPVARYQPKSAFNVGSSVPGATPTPKVVMSLPSNFKRAPGSLPMYLNTSESKSTTVPTIQLVARNTKLLENIVDKSSPGKVVSIKISTPQASKGIPAQVLTNAGLQYLVSTTKAAQRIILPNMSTSVPIPIISPISGKTLQKNLVPVPIGAPVSSPAGKKSVSVGEKIRLLGGKVSDSNKTTNTLLSLSSNTKALSTLPSLPVFDSFTKPAVSGTTTSQGRAATITVSVLQTSPSISTAAAKIMPHNSSPNSFQSTFSKLISGQNPVPKYCPPKPPENLNMDMSGQTYHQCLECKDSFMFQNSLVDHYERRSIMIKVRCMQCNESLLFLNKCKLLKHARQHSDKGGGMQFNNAHISPLPLSMCKPRSKESFLNTSASSLAEKRRSTTSSEDDLSSSIGSSIMTCTDCNFVASTAEALEEHFQQQTTPASPEAGTSGATSSQPSNFTCDMCNLALQNQCSFMAHMRMHKRIAPHTCPECGQTFDYDGKDMDFNLHLSIQCFHLSRMSCYKCRLCSSIFKNADLLRRHLEVRHLQTFYKCRDCPMAFKTQENINSHQRSAHGVVVATKMIHKCPLCDTVFTDNSPTQQIFLLQKHFEAHINHPSINITAYKCLFCNNIYERKSLLREHLKSVHDVTSSAETSGSRDLSNEINNAKLLLSIEKKNKGVSGATAKKVGRKRSLNDSMSGKEVPLKVQKTALSAAKSVEDANSRIASGILGEGSSKKGGLGSGGMKHTRQPVKLRLKGMTGNSTISIKVGGGAADVSGSSSLPGAASGLEGRIRVVVAEDGRKMFSCKECGKEFPSQNTCINHMRIKHEGIRTLYCCPHCPVDTIKFAKRISLKKHLKRVHSLTEIRKQDVRLVYAHVPPVPEGQRFDPSTLVLDNGKIVSQTKDSPKVRKKVTSLGRKNGDRTSGRMRRRRPVVQSPSIHVSSSDDEPVSHADSEDVSRSGDDDMDFSKLKLPDVYTCAKCDFESADRLEFQVHIIEHKEEAEFDESFSSIRQCTECGLCFASAASHAKHLFIKHKIKRKRLLENYDKQLRAEREAAGSLPKSLMGENGDPSSSSGGANAKKHRCSVCCRRFEDDSQLRTHMRTHGLAFVKSKAEG